MNSRTKNNRPKTVVTRRKTGLGARGPSTTRRAANAKPRIVQPKVSRVKLNRDSPRQPESSPRSSVQSPRQHRNTFPRRTAPEPAMTPSSKLLTMRKLAGQIPKCITTENQSRLVATSCSHQICLKSFLSGNHTPVMWNTTPRVVATEADINLMDSDRYVHLLDMDPHLGLNHKMKEISGSTATTTLVRHSMQTDTLTFPLWKSGLDFLPKILHSTTTGVGTVLEGSISRLEYPESFLGLSNRDQLMRLCKCLVLRRSIARGPSIFLGLGHHMLFACIKELLFELMDWLRNNHVPSLAVLQSALPGLAQNYEIKPELSNKPTTKHLQFPNTAVTLLEAKRPRFYPGPIRTVDLLRNKICPELLTHENRKIGVHGFSKFHSPSMNLVQFCRDGVRKLRECLGQCDNKSLMSLVMSESGKWILQMPSDVLVLATIEASELPGLVAVEYADYGGSSHTTSYNFSCVGHLTLSDDLEPTGITDSSNEWIPHKWFARMFLFSKLSVSNDDRID